MFDTSYELVGASVNEVTVDTGQEGVLELTFIAGLTFPIAGPDNNPLRVPTGQIRFQLTRSQAIEFCEKAIAAAEDLPKGSNIVVADEKQADQVAKTLEGIKKDGQ